MNKKKIIIIILVVIIIIGVALSIYFFIKKNKRQVIPSPTTTTQPQTEARLIIKTKPINAHLSISTINSSFVKDIDAPAEIDVPAEKLYVVAYYPYYDNSTQEVEIKSGETKTIEMTLSHSGFEIKEGGPIQTPSNNRPNNLIPNP